MTVRFILALVYLTNSCSIANVVPLPDFLFILNLASQSDGTLAFAFLTVHVLIASQNDADNVVPSPHLPFSFNSASLIEPMRMGDFNTSSFNWTDPSLFDAMTAMIVGLPSDLLSSLTGFSEDLESNTNMSPTRPH